MHDSRVALSDLSTLHLLQYIRIKAAIDLALECRNAIRLERGDESTETRGENDQITGALSSTVGVGDTRGHKNRCARTNGLDAIGITESQLAVKDMPRFIIRMMNVKNRRATAPPFVDAK
jgi:hypothetical protein